MGTCLQLTPTVKVGHTGNENRSHFVGGYVGRWVGTCVQLTLTLKLGHTLWVAVWVGGYMSEHYDSETRSH